MFCSRELCTALVLDWYVSSRTSKSLFSDAYGGVLSIFFASGSANLSATYIRGFSKKSREYMMNTVHTLWTPLEHHYGNIIEYSVRNPSPLSTEHTRLDIYDSGRNGLVRSRSPGCSRRISRPQSDLVSRWTLAYVFYRAFIGKNRVFAQGVLLPTPIWNFYIFDLIGKRMCNTTKTGGFF